MENNRLLIERDLLGAQLKESYSDALNKLLQNDTFDQQKYIAAQKAATAYFNHEDQTIAYSDLLGGLGNSTWALHRAESCKNLLHSILEYDLTMRNILEASEYKKESFGDYSPSAFSHLQRMVVKYLPTKVSELKEKFSDQNIPIEGFEKMNIFGNAAVENIPVWRWVLCALGFLTLAASMCVIFFVNEMNPLQIKSISLTRNIALTFMLIPAPGAVELKYTWKLITLEATGFIAVFFALNFFL